MSKRPNPLRARLRRRLHRSRPALLLALLALIGQIGLGMAMPAALAPLLAGSNMAPGMNMSSAICQDMDGHFSGTPTPPAPASHAHHEDCALCPACQAVTAALPLLPGGTMPPVPVLRLAGIVAPVPEAALSRLRLAAAYPRGPPTRA